MLEHQARAHQRRLGRDAATTGRSPSSTAGCSSRACSGVQPLVSFGHSRTKRRALPTPARVQVRVPPVPRALPVGQDLRDVERGEPLRRADVPPRAARRRVLAQAARGVPDAARSSPPSCSTCRTCSAGSRSSGKPAGRPSRSWWGLHNYVEANRFHADAAAEAAAPREGRGVADRGRRHRQAPDARSSTRSRRIPESEPRTPPRDALPVRRPPAGSTRASRASTSTTGTRRRSPTRGTRPSSGPTTARGPVVLRVLCRERCATPRAR